MRDRFAGHLHPCGFSPPVFSGRRAGHAEWIDLLKRIQDGGKAVHASCKPEGLCIGTYALNKEHADQLIEKVKDWAGKTR